MLEDSKHLGENIKQARTIRNMRKEGAILLLSEKTCLKYLSSDLLEARKPPFFRWLTSHGPLELSYFIIYM
jgi:hypothetical protein